MLPRNAIIRFGFTLSVLTGSISAAEFTRFTDTSPTGLAALASAVMGNNPRITIVPGSVQFKGTTTQGTPSTSYAKHFDLGTHGDSFYELSQDGVLFTTGDGAPPLINTSSSFGVAQAVNVSDPGLTTLVGNTTEDTTALEFDFTIEAGVKSLGFEFMFMSEEYPEFADTTYVDAAAVYVDGVNYAYYNNDPTKYLSVKSNLISGVSLFFDNQASVLPIEYDGVTRPAGILAPLNTALATHHLRIVVADTGDQIYDTAILVSDVFGSDRVIPTGEAGIVPLASPRMINYNVSTFEGAPPTTIPVRLSQPALEAVTVTYEIAGTPVLGTDFTTSTTTVTGTISFGVGAYLQNVDITPLLDGVIDGDKTLTFRLTDATKAIALRNKTVTINIYDVDAKGASSNTGSLSGNPSGAEAIEGKEQGNNRCGSGTGLAVLFGVGGLVAWRRRRW